jgi:hypothetical protein
MGGTAVTQAQINAMHATCLHLHAEVARLTAELEKPVLGPWVEARVGTARKRYPVGRWDSPLSMASDIAWMVRTPQGPGHELPSGPIVTNADGLDANMRAADLAAAPFYRLVGGVFGEVSDG